MRQVGDKKYEGVLKVHDNVLIKKERRRYHILLVDDDSLRRTVIAFLCEESGFVISQANSGEQARSMIDEGRYEYDLVMVDSEMPEMSGLTLVNAMKKSHPDIPVFVAAAFQDKLRFMELLNDDDKSVNKFLLKRMVIKQ